MSDFKITPDKFERRSFLYRRFSNANATWIKNNNYAAVNSITNTNEESNYANNLALCDLSYLQRIGFKGNGTTEWLKGNNIKIPNNVNTSIYGSNDCIVARLGHEDVLILDNINHETNIPETLNNNWHSDYAENKKPCGFIMPRQESHACFSISGKHAPDMFSKLCAIDLRTKVFKNHMIVQTSLARITAIIIRNDLDTLNHYLVLIESALAEYCWDCLIDAMNEFEGHIIGSSVLASYST